MTRAKLIATACATAMLAVLTLSVAAQDFNTNERTYLTFSNAVELPGVTLQPGTYLFRLADSQSNRHIVQVFNQDEKQILTTILAVPAERLEVTGETVVTFRETAEGGTPAVQYWYYPGDKVGHEFVYPKDQALRIAKRTGQDVLSMEGEVASSGTTVSSVNAQGEVSEWKRETTARSAEAQPQPETVAPSAESPDRPGSETPPAESAATATTPPAPTPTPSAQAETRTQAQDRTATSTGAVGTTGAGRELPRTASFLPLSGLIGLLSLGGAMALRRTRS
jgi:hypothetical protein